MAGGQVLGPQYPPGYQTPKPEPWIVSQDDVKQTGAPAGYTYDPVVGHYVPIVGSPTDVLAQRLRSQGISDKILGQLTSAMGGFGGSMEDTVAFHAPSGGGGGGGGVSSVPGMQAAPPVPEFHAPTAADIANSTAARIATIELPDDSAAQAANFARSKDQVGQETAGSMTALRSALAGRGLLGGGMEVKGTSNILSKGQGELGNTTRENMTNEAKRIDDFAKLGYQGAIEQRGQDITTTEGAANRALDAAKTGYTGQITQRGQDIGQNEAQFTGNVAQRGQDVSAAEGAAGRQLSAAEADYSGRIQQRGQDITARGQALNSLSALMGKLY